MGRALPIRVFHFSTSIVVMLVAAILLGASCLPMYWSGWFGTLDRRPAQLWYGWPFAFLKQSAATRQPLAVGGWDSQALAGDVLFCLTLLLLVGFLIEWRLRVDQWRADSSTPPHTITFCGRLVRYGFAGGVAGFFVWANLTEIGDGCFGLPPWLWWPHEPGYAFHHPGQFPINMAIGVLCATLVSRAVLRRQQRRHVNPVPAGERPWFLVTGRTYGALVAAAVVLMALNGFVGYGASWVEDGAHVGGWVAGFPIPCIEEAASWARSWTDAAGHHHRSFTDGASERFMPLWLSLNLIANLALLGLVAWLGQRAEGSSLCTHAAERSP